MSTDDLRNERLKVGQRVRVPRGTRIVSDLHPQTPPGFQYAQRTQVITIDHFSARARDGRLHGTVRWAGRGGYWREAWADQVEPLPDTEGDE